MNSVLFAAFKVFAPSLEGLSARGRVSFRTASRSDPQNVLYFQPLVFSPLHLPENLINLGTKNKSNRRSIEKHRFPHSLSVWWLDIGGGCRATCDGLCHLVASPQNEV